MINTDSDKENVSDSSDACGTPDQYFVVRRSEVNKFMTPLERTQFAIMRERINSGRVSDGRRPLRCICVEEDWPEYELVLEMLEKRLGKTEIPFHQPSSVA